ncbi:MAG: ribbon-helix-helix protein, CopG family [Spirochaetales bacterium]|nr:ribbon-helix-helix protein, CopG family [Spirochaetales bacterium]
MIAVRVPKEIEDRLDRIAKLTGRTKTFYVREAILEHLDELEDAYVAEKVLENVRSGKEETVLLDDLLKEYGVDN